MDKVDMIRSMFKVDFTIVDKVTGQVVRKGSDWITATNVYEAERHMFLKWDMIYPQRRYEISVNAVNAVV